MYVFLLIAFRLGTLITWIERVEMDLFLMGERIGKASVVIHFFKNQRISAKSALPAFNVRCNQFYTGNRWRT